MKINFSSLSRVISHALRHEPWLYGLEIDEEGWVSVANLLSSLRSQQSEWEKLDENRHLQNSIFCDKRTS